MGGKREKGLTFSATAQAMQRMPGKKARPPTGTRRGKPKRGAKKSRARPETGTQSPEATTLRGHEGKKKGRSKKPAEGRAGRPQRAEGGGECDRE